MRELWVVEARRRLIHRHDGVTPDGYVRVDLAEAATHLVPGHAPEGFAMSLEEV